MEIFGIMAFIAVAGLGLYLVLKPKSKTSVDPFDKGDYTNWK